LIIAHAALLKAPLVTLDETVRRRYAKAMG